MSTLSNPDAEPPLLYSGRISKQAFTISTSTLLGICWITAAIRFYVRIGLQRRIFVDDAFLLFGLCACTVGVGLAFDILDQSYLVESFLLGQETLASQPGLLQHASFRVHKIVTCSIALCWAAISCVKLSFMFFFRRLVDRLPRILIYWWFVLAFVLAISLWGLTVPVLVCPFFDTVQIVQCSSDSGFQREWNYSVSQITLDIIGDLLILVIPVQIVWKIKLRRRQKFWLALSLCLTAITVAVSIIRVLGMKTPDSQSDTIWEFYCMVVSAEVGLIMTSATSFRILYISTAACKQEGSVPNLNKSSIKAPLRITEPLLNQINEWYGWITKNRSITTRCDNIIGKSDYLVNQEQLRSLPHHVELKALPRVHLTGVRTIIGNPGEETRSVMSYSPEQSYPEEQAVETLTIELQNLANLSISHQQQHQQQNGYNSRSFSRFDSQYFEKQELV